MSTNPAVPAKEQRDALAAHNGQRLVFSGQVDAMRIVKLKRKYRQIVCLVGVRTPDGQPLCAHVWIVVSLRLDLELGSKYRFKGTVRPYDREVTWTVEGQRESQRWCFEEVELQGRAK